MKKGIEYKNNNKTKSDSEKKDYHNHNTYTDVSGFAEATSYFENWFNNVSRYLFEEDLSFYREVYKYLYENDSDYTKIINTIDGMDSYNNAESSQSCLNNNPCSVYCNFDNTGKNYSCTNTTFTECTKSSTKYKSCYNAYNSCKNVPTSEYENCMRGKIGDEYTNLESKVTNFRKIIENLETSLAQDMVSNLSKVSSPTLNVEFNGPYKIKCSDVEIFHTIYVILQIAAPIAVILFGSFDYAKAVMASDIEKMEKAKKKFPKRLLLVLLFVFVPIIINAILSLYSMSTDKDIDTSLMYCVIKGS